MAARERQANVQACPRAQNESHVSGDRICGEGYAVSRTGAGFSILRIDWMRIFPAARSQLRTCLLLLAILCLSSLFLWPQPQPSPQRKETSIGAQEPLRTATASRVDRSPKLDGTLDDPLWQQATPLVNFLQREPYEGKSSTAQTAVRILYTRQEVYFGITCFDSHPSGIGSTELRRDVSQELDNYFEIVIDSDHDRRNAYVFQVNPRGTQRDALITEEQRTDTSTGEDRPGWDGVLTSEARN